jgi:hypothetical protein
MKLPHRRQFLHLAAGAAALPTVSRVARAQTYPTKPVRLIVGYAPADRKTLSRGSLLNGFRTGLASNSLLRTE